MCISECFWFLTWIHSLLFLAIFRAILRVLWWHSSNSIFYSLFLFEPKKVCLYRISGIAWRILPIIGWNSPKWLGKSRDCLESSRITVNAVWQLSRGCSSTTSSWGTNIGKRWCIWGGNPVHQENDGELPSAHGGNHQSPRGPNALLTSALNAFLTLSGHISGQLQGLVMT